MEENMELLAEKTPEEAVTDPILLQLQEQNRLLQEQNTLLKALVEKTPDKKTVDDGFKEQKRHLEFLTKAQRTETTFSWIRFALIAIAVIVIFVLLFKAWQYFQSVASTFEQFSETLNQYAEQFSSSFGKLDESLQDISEFFGKFRDFFHLG